MSPWLQGLSRFDLEWVDDRATFLQHDQRMTRAEAEQQAVRELRDREKARARHQKAAAAS